MAETAAGVPVGVVLVDGTPQPAQAPLWDRTASLHVRLLLAQDDVSVLTKDSDIKGKSKDGAAYSYKGITGAQIVARAKSALVAHGVLYTPVVQRDSLKMDGNRTMIWVDGTFVNVDDKTDCMTLGAYGEGIDNAGNAFAKAFTNANKQILSKSLNMTTVEDDTPSEIQHEPSGGGAAVREADAATDVAVKTWADAFKRALDSCGSLNELKKIRAENAHMMKSDRVPDATRDYFINKIAGLEGALP